MNFKFLYKYVLVVSSFLFLCGMGEVLTPTNLKDNGAVAEGESVVKVNNGWVQPVHPVTGRTPSEGATVGDWALTPQDVWNALPDSFNCDLDKDSNEIQCLVCNCFHENANEPAEGRINVNRVVYTREMVPNFPNSICGVITQPYQFSWLNKGMKQRHQVLYKNGRSQGVHNCIETTAEASKYRGTWFASNYHADYVSPNWRSGCRGANQVGRHIFYTGGCYGVKPPTNFPTTPKSRQNDAISWLELFFKIPTANAAADPVSTFLKENGKYKLKTDFSKDVEKLLGEKTNPAIVKGDFNGDGVEDSVAILIKDKKHYMMFFASNGKGFIQKSREIPEIENIYLTTVSKKYVLAGLPNNKARDLVQLEIFMGPTQAYFVEKTKVIEFKGKLKQSN